MAQDPTKYADMEKALAAFKEIGTVALSGEGELLGVAVFKHLRLGIHPREVVDEPRLAHMAGLAGISVELATKINRQLEEKYPRYGAQPGDAEYVGQHVPQADVLKDIVSTFREETVRIEPALAKAMQTASRAHNELLAVSCRNGNSRRAHNRVVTAPDINRFQTMSSVTTLNDPKGEKLTSPFNGKRRHRS